MSVNPSELNSASQSLKLQILDPKAEAEPLAY